MESGLGEWWTYCFLVFVKRVGILAICVVEDEKMCRSQRACLLDLRAVSIL